MPFMSIAWRQYAIYALQKPLNNMYIIMYAYCIAYTILIHIVAQVLAFFAVHTKRRLQKVTIVVRVFVISTAQICSNEF